MVAAASGTTWEAFVQAHFLDPLGMSDTLTSVGALAGPRRMWPRHMGRWARAPARTRGTARGPAARRAVSISSARDMTRWLLLQLGRGTLDGRQYFTDAQARTMWTPHVSFTDQQGVGDRSHRPRISTGTGSGGCCVTTMDA